MKILAISIFYLVSSLSAYELDDGFFKEVHFEQTHRILDIQTPGEELELDPLAVFSKPMESLYIADAKKNRIYKTTPEGELLGILNPPSGLKNPIALTSLNSQDLAVLDGAGHRILIFNEYDQEVGKIGSQGSEKNQLLYPKDFIYDSRTKSFLIADYGNLRILELDRDGNFIKFFLYINPKTLEKGAPISLALAGNNLFVLYPDYNELVLFDRSSGDLKKIISGASLDEKLLINPKMIAAGPGDSIFLSEPSLKSILVFNSEGELEDRLQLPWRPFFGIEKPGPIKVDSSGSLYIIDEKDRKVHRLAARKELQYLFEADQKYSRGAVSNALDLYEKVLEVNPQNSSAARTLIKILQVQSERELSLKDYDSALKKLNRILTIQPSNRNALTIKRIVLWHRNKDWIENLGLCLLSLLFLGLIFSILLERSRNPSQEAS
mgnify:CR=1 FL=1